MRVGYTAYFWLCATTLVCCLLLGGGTRGGFLSDAVLQLLSIPLLLAALWRLGTAPTTSQNALGVGILSGAGRRSLAQLIPLPPTIWTMLPGRAAAAAAPGLLERELTWMPFSVSPTATWLSFLSLIPPLAVFLGTLVLGYRERRLLSLVVLAVGVFSVFVGLAQVAQGPSSSLRLFEYTNESEAVGFFANRNHFAALLYSLMLFAAAWAVAVTLDGDEERGYRVVPIVACFTVIVVLIAAQAMTRSRAGLGLTMVALVGAFALAFVGRPRASGMAATKLLGPALALALVFGVQFALYRVLERFALDPLQDGRLAFARVTTEAAKAFAPLGSGMGTFVPSTLASKNRKTLCPRPTQSRS